MEIKTAILVDGGFYRKRAHTIWGKKTAKERADMKIGIDIAHLSYKKLADQIILIAGDSDFVPAAKIARREGVDFIIDAMGSHIADDLLTHVDGFFSHWRDPRNKSDGKSEPTQ